MYLPQLSSFFRRLPGSASRTESIRATKPCIRLTSWTLRSHRCCAVCCCMESYQHTVSTRRYRDLLDLRINRYPHFVLLPRIWQLRNNFSAYDAAYIALAETLGAALVTRDGRLASASGHAASVELF